MRILILSAGYLPRVGGLEYFVGDLARFFVQQNHSVFVVTQRYPLSLQKKEIIDGIKIERILFFDPKKPPLGLRSIAAYLFTLLAAPVNFLAFLRHVRTCKPDIINYHFVGSPTLFLLMSLPFYRKKLVVSLHGADVNSVPFESKVSLYLFRAILDKARSITVNSHYTLSKARTIKNNITAKAHVIHNGIDVEGLLPIAPKHYDSRYIFAAGRLVQKKGFDVFIKAISLIEESLQGHHVIIAGDGPERDNLALLVKSLHLQEKVTFYGPASRKEIISLIKGCRLFVLPSRDEPFGIIALEALFCRKPIVATRSGGVEEILKDRVNSLLVPADNPVALAETIQKVLTDENLSASISNNREGNEHFTLKKAGEKYLNVFEGKGKNS